MKIKSLKKLFKGQHFERDIIILVRWYLRYKLSYRYLAEMMAERGLTLSRTTILRWVQRFVPAFEKKWLRGHDTTYTEHGSPPSHGVIERPGPESSSPSVRRSAAHWRGEPQHRSQGCAPS